jgi:hypothetical protein
MVLGFCRILNVSRAMALLMVLCGSSFSASSQSFRNLNFESIGGTAVPSDGIWLNWSLAAPGWTHPSGGDSVFVYHRNAPQDSIAQFYFLIDSTSTKWSPLEGDYSLALFSGHFNRNDASSPWVSSSIEQTGVIPVGAQSFHFLAQGDFSLSLNSSEIPVTRLADDSYAADVSKFAGETVSLRFRNNSTEVQQPLILDGMGFSVQSIPEPSSASLLLFGVVTGVLVRRARRTCN